MNKIIFHKKFEKQYAKIDKRLKETTKERLKIFIQDEFNPILNNHPLQGKYKGYRSININSDIRALYKMKTINCFIFLIIDNHNNLYKK